MKQIDEYFVTDDFSYVEELIHGVPVWIANNHIYLDKRNMIWNNAIAYACSICGKPTQNRSWPICETCREKKKVKQYLQLDAKTSEVNTIFSDQYYEYIDDLSDFFYSKLEDISIEDLVTLDIDFFRFHPCKEVHPYQVDLDVLCEESYEDFDTNDLSDAVINATEILNSLLAKEVIGVTSIDDKRLLISEDMQKIFKDCVEYELKERETQMRNNT